MEKGKIRIEITAAMDWINDDEWCSQQVRAHIHQVEQWVNWMDNGQ